MNKNEDSLSMPRIKPPSDLAILPALRIPVTTLRPPTGGVAIKPHICICCGEPMVEQGNSMSRDPNVCASCSSLADGIEEGNQPVGNGDYAWQNAGISVPIQHQPQTLGDSDAILP